MEQPLRADHAAPSPAFGSPATAGSDAVGAAILALAAAVVFAVLLLGTVGFRLGTHPDETSKVLAVLNHWNNYNHPLLMLHLARGANALAGLTDAQSVAELGRSLAVLAGALAVFATFLLARVVLPPAAALAAAAATAATPLVAMHARHFKEDIFLLPLLLLALLALIETLEAPARWRAILLGAAAGFAASAKYVGLIVAPFAMVVLLFGLTGTERRERVKLCALVLAVAAMVFGLMHLAALWDFKHYGSAVYGNLRQAQDGVGVRVPLALGDGIFHLRYSLLPGLGAPLLVLGLAGFAAPFLAPPGRRKPLLVIASFAAIWLVAHEASPFRPFPNFQRHMVASAPLLIILGTAFVYELIRRRFPTWSGAIAAAAILVAALPALYASWRIAGPPEADLRGVVPALVLRDTPDAAFDNYTRFSGQRAGGQNAGHARPAAARSTLLVTSSFVYDRYRALGASDLQSDEVRGRAARYADLFARPYLEVSNGRPSFAFFNPVFRIVALDGDEAHLQRLATELRAKHPNLSTTLVNVRLP